MASTTQYHAEVKVGSHTTPPLEHSILRQRIKAVYAVDDDGAKHHVGTASGFYIREVAQDKILMCKIDVDDDSHDDAISMELHIDDVTTLELGSIV